jgi:hypothetical protein
MLLKGSKQELQMERLNCWEVMGCGRQKGGENAKEFGVCPAALAGNYEGLNKGKHGGRFCWVVAGTLCGGEVQGTYARKMKNCLNCNYFKQVHQEEERFFILTPGDAQKDKSF